LQITPRKIVFLENKIVDSDDNSVPAVQVDVDSDNDGTLQPDPKAGKCPV